MRHRHGIRTITTAFVAVLGFGFVSFVLAENATPPIPENGRAAQAGHRREAAYLAENEAAMALMMKGMAVKPTGDIDRDFVAMMEPHHQGAIDMAQALLRYGTNEQLKRLAQEIIVTQQQEIAVMRLAIGEPLVPSMASPTQSVPASKADP
ncbi:DUF305 domain-containing protein [Beijerinckiaceae bacterium]|nr:DUF305 domain-containing protein [Beijerinckiaceae bacterium]